MGWFQRLWGSGSEHEQKEAHSFHVYDLVEWLNNHGQEIIVQKNLGEDVQQYVSSLKQKRSFLESNLYIWHQRISPNDAELKEILLQIKNMVSLLTFPPQPTVSSLLTLHSRLEPQLRALQKRVEQSEGLEILFRTAEADSSGNPILQTLVEVSRLQEAFE